MSERNYYVICDDNCRFESMTKEQIIAAIAEATGETPVHIDDAFITKIKEKNANAPLSFWVGTQAQYNAIAEKEENCFYIITDDTSVEEMQTALAGMVETVTTLGENVDALSGAVTDLVESAELKDVVIFDADVAGHRLQVNDVLDGELLKKYRLVRVDYDDYTSESGCRGTTLCQVVKFENTDPRKSYDYEIQIVGTGGQWADIDIISVNKNIANIKIGLKEDTVVSCQALVIVAPAFSVGDFTTTLCDINKIVGIM